MFSVPEFLDRAKKGAGVTTDYALAKLLGHKSQANVSNWRLEKVAPDERSILKLCEFSGDDPEHVAACIQSMRAANDDVAADLWRRVAERLRQHGASSVAFAVTLATLFAAAFTEPVQAAPDLLNSRAGVCVLCLIASARLLIRLTHLARVKRNHYGLVPSSSVNSPA